MAGSKGMGLANVQKVMKFSLESDRPIVLWGESGLGKTEWTHQMAEQLGEELNDTAYEVVELHLATQDVVDLIGVPETENGKTKWRPPEWLKTQGEDGPPRLYFLDEFNRASNDEVLRAMLPFLAGGNLHTHQKREQDRIVAAANPVTEDNRYDVRDIWDFALLNRLGHVKFQPNKDEWFNFVDSKVDRVTLQLCHDHHEVIEPETFELPFNVKPTRRTILEVGKHMKDRSQNWIKNNAFVVNKAYLGPEYATLWNEAKNKTVKSLQATDILDNFQDDEVQEAMEEILNDENIRTDLINRICEGLLDMCENAPEFTEEQIDNMSRFILELPADMINKVISDDRFHNMDSKMNGELLDQWLDIAIKDYPERADQINEMINVSI